MSAKFDHSKIFELGGVRYTQWEIRHLVEYSILRGWIRRVSPFIQSDLEIAEARTWAPELIQRCIKRGWIKPAESSPRIVVVQFRCGGEFKTHSWEYIPGIGDRCRNCNAEPTRRYNRKTQPVQVVAQGATL